MTDTIDPLTKALARLAPTLRQIRQHNGGRAPQVLRQKVMITVSAGLKTETEGLVLRGSDGRIFVFPNAAAEFDRICEQANAAEKQDLVADVVAALDAKKTPNAASRRAEFRRAYDELTPTEIEGCATATALHDLLLKRILRDKKQTKAALQGYSYHSMRRALAGYRVRPGKLIP